MSGGIDPFEVVLIGLVVVAAVKVVLVRMEPKAVPVDGGLFKPNAPVTFWRLGLGYVGLFAAYHVVSLMGMSLTGAILQERLSPWWGLALASVWPLTLLWMLKAFLPERYVEAKHLRPRNFGDWLLVLSVFFWGLAQVAALILWAAGKYDGEIA